MVSQMTIDYWWGFGTGVATVLVLDVLSVVWLLWWLTHPSPAPQHDKKDEDEHKPWPHTNYSDGE